MFDIETIELENFRSFRGKHSFMLPEAPGLYLITGKNEIEPRLGSNGVGKSTLLDSLYWCLYGRTTRGLKAGDVISWDETSCRVSVELAVTDSVALIKRTQNPNSLTLNSKPVSQEELQKYLRLGPEAFTYAVLLPQFGESFFDLPPAAKLTLFSQIMELDFWLEKSKQAGELAEEIAGIKTAKELAASKCEGQIESAANDLEQLEAQLHEFTNTQGRVVAELKKEQRLLAESAKKGIEAVKFAERALINIERKLEKLSTHAKVCPTCKQKIENKDAEALLRNKSDFSRELSSLQRVDSQSTERLRGLQQSIETEQKRSNPYAVQIKQKLAAVEAVKVRHADLLKQITSLDEDHAAASFWINGFKRLRLFIVEETLRQLEIEVNNNMSSLGLTDWRIEFDVERENKSGGITKGFVVFVYPSEHAEPVRFEAYSGGESQRLRLAGDLGLANLIMERAGLRSTVEFFDEPSRHLSQEGLLDVAETLNQRALQAGKRIFLVDHATIDFGDFADRFLVKKGRGGSCLGRI